MSSQTMQIAGLNWSCRSRDHWVAQSGEIRFDARFEHRSWVVSISETVLGADRNLRTAIEGAIGLAIRSLEDTAHRLRAGLAASVRFDRTLDVTKSLDARTDAEVPTT